MTFGPRNAFTKGGPLTPPIRIHLYHGNGVACGHRGWVWADEDRSEVTCQKCRGTLMFRKVKP